MPPRKPLTIEVPSERLSIERQIAAEDDVKDAFRQAAAEVRRADGRSLRITFEIR